ncbi:hypothetical protein [Halocella sp. SP3-1]|uniref:hypothetical protein n=1 Tax=Halocella sp. SP3-1 TaxID=2382161 RepID=UPI000F7532C7|nr:hypothetical protein [Halocella sp. SP3-1]AZO95282.1 hypothetical protein D7D81_12145 [Halocella sp. SP3-1]
MTEDNSKYMDFDEYFEEMEAEQEESQLSFTFKDKTYYLPDSMPAILPVKIMRLKKKYGKEKNIPEDEIYVLMLNLLDEDELEEIASKATSDQLNKILIWILNQYKSAGKDDEEGNQKTQQKAKKK